MEPITVQKKQTSGTPDITHAVWDPFWFMRAMFGWVRPIDVPSSDAKVTDDAPPVDVKETDGAYVCTFKLALPDQADGGRVTAKLDQGELTVVVPKAAAVAPDSAPRPKTRQTGKGRGSVARAPRRGARSRSRRG